MDFDQSGGAFNHLEGDKVDVSYETGNSLTFAELQTKFSQSGGNSIITFDNSNSITLIGVVAAQLQQTDFILSH